MDVDISLLLQFLNLEDMKEQAEFLYAHQSELSDRFLALAAASLDYTETSTDPGQRCQDLIRVLQMKRKYESGRI